MFSYYQVRSGGAFIFRHVNTENLRTDVSSPAVGGPRNIKKTVKPSGRYKRLPAGVHGLDPEAVRSDQRTRLAAAMVELTAKRGYHAIRIVDLTRLARVSRPTFYALYADKEECFIEAYDLIAKRMTRKVVDAFLQSNGREERVKAAIAAFAQIALTEQDETSLMVLGALGAGPRALQRHHRVLALVQSQLEGNRSGSGSAGVNLSTNMIIGGIREVTAKRLRQGRVQEVPGLVEELSQWALSYPTKIPPSLARGAANGNTNGKQPATQGSDRRAPRPARADGNPGRLPSGRHELSRQFVLNNQRARIVDAVAEIVAEKGYAGLTIPEIARRANISHQTFYEIYPSKHDAFLGAQEVGTLHGVEAGGIAYQAQKENWPIAIGQGIRAAVCYFAAQPAQARLNLVDVLAAGPEALEIRERGLQTYAQYLDPGQQLGTAPRIAPEAVTGGAWQIIHQYVVSDRTHELPELVPQLIYLVLTPFIGPKEAGKVARRKPPG